MWAMEREVLFHMTPCNLRPWMAVDDRPLAYIQAIREGGEGLDVPKAYCFIHCKCRYVYLLRLLNVQASIPRTRRHYRTVRFSSKYPFILFALLWLLFSLMSNFNVLRPCAKCAKVLHKHFYVHYDIQCLKLRVHAAPGVHNYNGRAH